MIYMIRDVTRNDTHINTRKRCFMINNEYTILDFAEEFGKNKQLVRRRLFDLQIESINKDKREYSNEPLRYNYDAYIELAKDFGVSKSNTRQHTDDTQSNTQQYTNYIGKDKLIEVLERELEHSKSKLEKAEQEKDNLYRLLNQQQQLSFNDKNKIEVLELEIKENADPKPIFEKKTRWYNIFKRRKKD